MLALRSQMFAYLRETLYRHALEYLQSARSEKKKKKILGKRLTIPCIDHFEGMWLVDMFSTLAPVLGPSQPKPATSPSYAVYYGGQYGTKYVTFESLLHAAFVADEMW